MSTALPTVPAGANAWTVYLNTLDAGFYNTPSKGFPARIYVLWGILLYGGLAAIIYSALLVVDYRRRGRKWWLWKTVKRPSGKYICLNQHALCSFGSIVSCFALWGYVYAEWDLYINKVSPDTSIIWRVWIWLPIWFQGYLISSASLQAYIITSEGVDVGGYSISAPVANGIFLGLGFAVVAECIVACTICTIRWRTFLHAYQAAREVLVDAEPTWTGTWNFTTIALLTPLYTEMLEVYVPFAQSQAVVTWGYVAAPFLLVLLNFGGLRLVSTLRAQIQYNLSRKGVMSTRNASVPATVSVNSARTGMTGMSSTPLNNNNAYRNPDGTEFDPSSTAGSTATANTQNTGITNSTMGFMWQPTGSGQTGLLKPYQPKPAASTGGVKPVLSDREKTLISLRRAEAELLIVCVTVVVLGLALTAISIWTAIAALNIVIVWNTLETTVFFVPWAYGTIVAVTLTLLSFNVIKNLASAPSSPSKSHANAPIELANTKTAQGTQGTQGQGQYEISVSISQGYDDDDYDDSKSRNSPLPALPNESTFTPAGVEATSTTEQQDEAYWKSTQREWQSAQRRQ